MNDDSLLVRGNSKASERRWPWVLSFLMNVLLIAILAGPWIWAYFSSAHVDAPGHYLEDTFHSIRAREETSWHQLNGGHDESYEERAHKKVSDSLDRVEAALKKPILDHDEVERARLDLAEARKELQQAMSHVMKHGPEEHSAASPPSEPVSAQTNP